MKKKIIIFCNIASLILILASIHAGDMILMFLFAGIIPGTNIRLAPIQMLGLMSVLASLVIFYIIVLPLARKLSAINTKQNLTTRRRLKRI